MELLTWTLLAVACGYIYYYFKRKLNYFDDLGVPYLPGYPLLGNLAGPFFQRKHITEVMRDIYNANPEAKYVGAFDFGRPVLLLRDPELIKNITIKYSDHFPDHKTFVDPDLDPLFGGNLFSMHGEKWKEARNLLSPAFTSSKMKAMFELMIECGNNFVNYLAKQPREALKMVGTKDLFTKYTNDVIATCAFGINIDSLSNPNNDFYVLGKEATNLEGILSVKFFLARAVPWFTKLVRMQFVSKKVGDFFKSIVKSTVSTRDERKITRPDMLQLMMDARGKDSKYLKLDITEMTAQAFIFFFGGFDTTSTQMCILAHELAINPDIQQKLQEEIEEVLLQTNGKPTYEAINGMPYLDAIFNESVRRHTQASFIDRLCKIPFELPPAVPGGKSFTIPAGMNVWVSGSAIHTDENYYDDPYTFNPDRYYHKKVTINDVHNLGFGIGPRSCIGNRFAILETKILFFLLLSKFNLKPNKKTCSPLKYSKKSFVIRADGGFWLDIEPRN